MEHLGIAKEQLQGQKYLAKARLTLEEQSCHQLLRLTKGTRDATLEWYKDRVEDTCEWFLKHEHFQTCLKQDRGPLVVIANPVCEKLVLTKYLIDHGQPQSVSICYYLFKDQDQNIVRQALFALLHRLFSQKLPLLEHAISQSQIRFKVMVNLRNSIEAFCILRSKKILISYSSVP